MSNFLKRCKKHFGFTIIQLVITMVIVATLAGIGIVGYQQHAKRADVETASNDLRVWGNNFEDAVDDIGYVLWDSNEDEKSKEKVKEYLENLEDVYMNCSFDKDTLRLVSFNDDHEKGFIVTMKNETDPWGCNYRMVYMINDADSANNFVDNIFIASPGPNSTWAEEMTTPIGTVPKYSEGDYDDDIIMSMTVRQVAR